MSRKRSPLYLCLLLFLMGAGCRLQTTSEPLALQAVAPSLVLSSTAGTLDSKQAISQGPLVLIFYRGHW